MIFINFLIPVFLGFYFIYRAVTSLDKIDQVQKKGIKTRAKVIKIREEKNEGFNDEDISYTINHSEVNYFFTVKFKDKNGREIVKELEFPITKNPNRNLPFDTDIIYFRGQYLNSYL